MIYTHIDMDFNRFNNIIHLGGHMHLCPHDCTSFITNRSPKEKTGVKRALAPGPTTPEKSPKKCVKTFSPLHKCISMTYKLFT